MDKWPIIGLVLVLLGVASFGLVIVLLTAHGVFSLPSGGIALACCALLCWLLVDSIRELSRRQP